MSEDWEIVCDEEFWTVTNLLSGSKVIFPKSSVATLAEALLFAKRKLEQSRQAEEVVK